MKKDNTLKELLVGIFAVGVLVQVICLFFRENFIYHTVGLWVGILASAGMAIHMKRSIEDGVDLPGEAGVKYMKRAYVMRTAIVCVVIAAVLHFELGNPFTILIGVMALKLAAYFQPWIHKIVKKKGE